MLSISWPSERAKDAAARKSMTPTERARLRISEWGVLVCMSGAVAVLGSVVSTTTLWLETLREGYCESGWYLSRPACADDWHPWPKFGGYFIYLSLSVLYALGSAALVAYVAPGAAMSGITGLKSYFQGFYVPHLLEPRTLVVKLGGIVLAAASGLWVGQEAPLAHVAVITVSVLAAILPLSEARRRDMALAASATGIAVAFSAPLGGVLFAVEIFVVEANVLPQRAVWMCFVSAVMATVVLRSIASMPSAWGGLLLPETGLFRVSFDRVWHAVELVPFALLGAIGGIYGAAVGKFSGVARTWYARYPCTSVGLLAAITAGAAYFSEISRMPSMELLAALFAECASEQDESGAIAKVSTNLCSNSHVAGLLATLLGALILAPLSFTLPVPSGILFPSIVVGALGGRLMGLLMSAVLERLPIILSTSFCPDERQHCITPGVYALVGAASVLAGVTRLTISSVVLMFETTGALTFIVPIMTGVIVSKWVSDTFGGDSRSIYSAWQVEEQLPALPNATTTAVPNMSVSAIMTTNVVSTLEDRPLPHCPHTCVPVLGPNNEYLKLIVARTGAEEPTLVLSPSSSFRMVVSAITELGIRIVVFCQNGRFCGLLTSADVVRLVSHNVVVIDVAADEFEILDEE